MSLKSNIVHWLGGITAEENNAAEVLRLQKENERLAAEKQAAEDAKKKQAEDAQKAEEARKQEEIRKQEEEKHQQELRAEQLKNIKDTMSELLKAHEEKDAAIRQKAAEAAVAEKTADEMARKDAENARKQVEIEQRKQDEEKHQQELQKTSEVFKKHEEALNGLTKTVDTILEKTSRIDVLASSSADKDKTIDRLRGIIDRYNSNKDKDFGHALARRIGEIKPKRDKVPTQDISVRFEMDLLKKFDELHDAGYVKQPRARVLNELLRQFISDKYNALVVMSKGSKKEE